MDWKQIFLNELEQAEAKYLSWGYVEGSFTNDELTELAEEFIRKNEIFNLTAEDLINDLTEHGMIGLIPTSGEEVWRTRMAETVRLIARLRQWFPSKSWQTSPTLVADFRFQQRQRVYPKRYVEAQLLIDAIESERILDHVELEVLRTFLAAKGPDFRLSEFQKESAIKMFRDMQEEKSRGNIVTAGTGTGKTLSFYLPALTWIASRIDQTRWTKAIALYPRNELLKDQFLDTLEEVRLLNRVLPMERPISIGALFGDVPKEKDGVFLNWKETPRGYICPFLKCPDCKGDLIWSKADLEQGAERLVCIKRDCSTTIDGNLIPLTRQSMRKNPPDILFTTTEMMNRNMSDHYYGALIGLYSARPPRIVLLDEVHTYTGTHGAQVALLLYRWQHLLNAPIQFAGLSATLRDAGDFFSQLTGVPRSDIGEIDSSIGEKDAKGNEYQLVLRGDPASGTSLLSTTIQTAMLLRRMLDVSSKVKGTTTYGSKLFLFTDDLDVTNRLFHTLLDAEARDDKNYKEKLDQEPLAALRSHYRDDNSYDKMNRMNNGQSWLFSESCIGHNLYEPLVIGRTSSQDTGVDTRAEVIVSSPSLEVGFNDKQVGAVIQHKAPRDLAAFLQRKGRAGRDPRMRPWMVTVLSDYGRDKYMYQSFDTLFQPEIECQALPIMNRYVLRIQAVFTFMDWVAYELNEEGVFAGSLWYMFAQPQESGAFRVGREKVQLLITRVLNEEAIRNKMETFIRKALHISLEDVRALLWDPPRSLMLEVLPNLLRRLHTNWGVNGSRVSHEMYILNHPLPEFVPSNLFSELSLPEVGILLPSGSLKQTDQMMDILQALNTFAPGRVSRRFGIDHGGQSHWIAPPSLRPNENGEPLELPLSTFCHDEEYRELGVFQYVEVDGEVIELPVVRPWKIRPVQSPANVDTKSNAWLVWKSQLFPANQVFLEHVHVSAEATYGMTAEIPRGAGWSTLIKDIRFFTHATHSAVTIRRFAVGSEASVRLASQANPVELSVRFRTGASKPAALGFVQQVDGLRFELFNLPESLIITSDSNSAKVRSFRSLYFQHKVMNDPVLKKIGNMFVLERMAEIYLSGLLHEALMNDCSLAEACEQIHAGEFPLFMDKVMNVFFQVLNNANTSEIEEEAQYQRTHLKLISLFKLSEVSARLKELASVLWSDADEDWQKWARKRWIVTLGEAILMACLELAGPHRNGELLLDIGSGPRKKEDGTWSVTEEEIWITETIEGGSGMIEEIASGYQREPRRFFRLVESALAPSDAEIVHSELSRILLDIRKNEELREQVRRFRTAVGYREISEAIKQLKSHLDKLGVLVTQPVMNGLFNRVLRPGSNADTDRFMFELLHLWEVEEQRLGVEMDARVFAYVCSADERKTAALTSALSHIDVRSLDNINWRFNVIYSMIWPRGSQIRRRALKSYNPFSSSVPSDRELVLDSMQFHRRVLYSDINWREQMTEILVAHGSVQLLIPEGQKTDIGGIILGLTSEPMDLGFLHAYPSVEGFTRVNDMYAVHFEIREALI